MEHPWTEYIFWWSQICLFVVATIGVIIAFVQLSTIASHAKATFLLELDRRFEGPELQAARRTMHQMREHSATLASQQHPQGGDAQRLSFMRQRCTQTIEEMRRQDPRGYSRLMRVLGFFETVGVMVKRNYIALDEIDRLFRGPILDIDMFFRDHIEQRGRETGVPDGLYEHALYLVSEVRRISGNQ